MNNWTNELIEKLIAYENSGEYQILIEDLQIQGLLRPSPEDIEELELGPGATSFAFQNDPFIIVQQLQDYAPEQITVLKIAEVDWMNENF